MCRKTVAYKWLDSRLHPIAVNLISVYTGHTDAIDLRQPDENLALFLKPLHSSRN